MSAKVDDFPHCQQVKKEYDALLHAKPGAPGEPIARIPSFADDIQDLVNEGITYKYNAAHIFDSAGAFFSLDNVGLPGLGTYFKVAAVAERADAWKAIDFLAKRGGRPELGQVAAVSSAKWSMEGGSDVLLAFAKALAIAKVGLQLENKGFTAASKHHDAQAAKFFCHCAEACTEKVRVWSHFLTHLKLVADDKHAIKNFERELKLTTVDFAYASAVEAVSPAKLQMGPFLRAQKKQSVDLEANWPEMGRHKEAYKLAQQ